jgi:hypothetical protein
LLCPLVVLPAAAHVMLTDVVYDYALDNTNVTLEVSGEPLVRVFDEIERQTRFLFLTPADKVKSYGRVELAKGTYTVKEALDYVLKKTPLRYKQKNNYIVIFQSTAGRDGRRTSTNDMALVMAEPPELLIHKSLTGEDVKKLILGFLYRPVKTFQSLQKTC